MKSSLKIFVFSLIAILGVFIFFSPKVEAAEGDCHLDWCFVPAPTIYLPDPNTTVSNRPDITGLTWQTTIVKVYLDGIELTNIKQVNNYDSYASFWARPDFALAPGRHYIYTIAYSEKPSPYGQSKESAYIYFDVPQIVKKSAPVATTEPVNKTVAKEEQKDEAETDTAGLTGIFDELAPDDQVVVQTEKDNPAQVEVEAGRIEGGVSVAGEGIPEVAFTESEQQDRQNNNANLQPAATYEQIGEDLNLGSQGQLFAEKMKENRVVGLVLLVIVLLAIGASVLIKRLSAAEVLLKEDDEIDQVPPPPASAIISDPFLWNVPETEIIKPAMEPIDVKDLDPKEYWGEASSAAYIQPVSAADRPVSQESEPSEAVANQNKSSF